MRLPAELCKMQRKKRETDGFSKSTLMTPPGSHPTSGFGARHSLPKFFRHKKRRIVQNDAANWWTRRGSNPRPLGCEPNALPAELRAHIVDLITIPQQGKIVKLVLKKYADVVQPEKAAGERRENVIPEVGKGLYHAYPVKNIVPDAKQRYENMLRHLRA